MTPIMRYSKSHILFPKYASYVTLLDFMNVKKIVDQNKNGSTDESVQSILHLDYSSY